MPISYDRLAPRYDKALAPFEKWFLGKLRHQAIAALPPNARILELGAGTGLNFVHYPPNARGVATEPNTEMLRIASERKKPDGFELVQNCGEHLPFADACFDAVLATLVLCSVQSPELVFAELRRVVRPGGTISLLEHVRPDGVLGPVFDFINLLTVPLMDDHFHRRPANTAANAGLEVLQVSKSALGMINLITCRVSDKF
jgi:ubiquinone/menaquinone biosynthesis C-methylase UbiE